MIFDDLDLKKDLKVSFHLPVSGLLLSESMLIGKSKR